MINKEKVTFTLDIDLAKKLDEISEQQCINKSKFVNKILKEYLKNHDNHREN